MAKIDTKELFENGRNIEAQIEELTDRRIGNRTLLRNLADAGMLSDAEVEELNELYPVRERRTRDEAGEEGEE